MRGLGSPAFAGVLSVALALASPATGAAPATGRARANAPGTKPAGMAVAPDLAATRAFVGTLDRGTNVYRPAPETGVETGQQLRIACFYTNSGAAASGSFRVRHVVDGRVVGVSNPLPALAGGANSVDGRDFTAGAPGMHRYECTINFDNAAADRTPSNNSAAADFRVLGPASMTPRDQPKPNVPAQPARPPRLSNVDLLVQQISAQDGFWSTDWQIIGVATVTATVKNVGMEAAPARAWTWQWTVDGVPRACGTSDPRFNLVSGQPASFGLTPGEGRAVSFYFKGLADSEIEALKPGFVRTYQVKVRFNCDLGQAERSDTNNESREIPVWFKARQGVPGKP
jgi:hypothetical protein